jgi:hypothetical protein
MIADKRAEELYELGDAESTGGERFSAIPHHDLTDEEREIYDCAFRNKFASLNGR